MRDGHSVQSELDAKMNWFSLTFSGKGLKTGDWKSLTAKLLCKKSSATFLLERGAGSGAALHARGMGSSG